MLKENHISPRKIVVFVANQEEYKEYAEKLDPQKYGKIVVGVKGLVPQRQFIMNQYPEGKTIVFFDDDVAKIDLQMYRETKGKTLDFFFRMAFRRCRKEKSYIWGVYPVFNPFFRKARPETTTCLNYIVGAFYGIINRPHKKTLRLVLTKENGQKEDVERTLLYFIEDGTVLRFNHVGFITKYYGKSGGLGTFEERLKPMLEASNRLKAKYPEYGDISTKKGGMTEFRLKKIPARSGSPSSSTKTQNNNNKKTHHHHNKTKRV
jgi:hypothetical protein